MALPQIGGGGAAARLGPAPACDRRGAAARRAILLMPRLLRDPRGRAPWYNATGTTLYVLGMLVTAFALRQAGRDSRKPEMTATIYDVVVVGGGPAGATAAYGSGAQGRLRAAARPRRPHQALRRRDSAAADRGFRDPRRAAGGARDRAARIVAPSAREVTCRSRAASSAWWIARCSMNGCATRAAAAGAERRTGTFTIASRRDAASPSCAIATKDGAEHAVPRAPGHRRRWRAVRRRAGRRCAAPSECRYVFAYHEIVRAPTHGAASIRRAATSIIAARCRPISTAGCSRTATPPASAPARPKGLRAAQGGRRVARTSRGSPGPRPSAAKARRSRCSRCAAGTTAATWCWRATPRASWRPASARASTTRCWAAGWRREAVGGDVSPPARRARCAPARKRFMRAHGQVFWVLGMHAALLVRLRPAARALRRHLRRPRRAGPHLGCLHEQAPDARAAVCESAHHGEEPRASHRAGPRLMAVKTPG